MKMIIDICNKKILVNTNNKMVTQSIVNYFDKFAVFQKENCEPKMTFNILVDKDMYNDNKIKHLCAVDFSNSELYYLFHKKNIVIINKSHKMITIIIDDLGNDFLDDINRIILNYIYKLLELDKIFFIEAGTISVNKQSIILLGEKSLVKDIINDLLKTDYNYVSTESIGIKFNEDKIKLFNLPEKTNIRKKYSSKIEHNTTLKEVILLENNFNIDGYKYSELSKQEAYSYFNIKYKIHQTKYISYINKIYNEEKCISLNEVNELYKKVQCFKLVYNKYNLIDICKYVKRIINK